MIAISATSLNCQKNTGAKKKKIKNKKQQKAWGVYKNAKKIQEVTIWKTKISYTVFKYFYALKWNIQNRVIYWIV